MSNYFAVSRHSNLIFNVIATSATPKDSDSVRFFLASEGQLNQYYHLKSLLHESECVDIGVLIPRKIKPRELLDLTADKRQRLIDYVLSNPNMTDKSIGYVWNITPESVVQIRG